MSKKNYTRVQELLPAIEAIQAGRIQRQVAEHCDFNIIKIVVDETASQAKKAESIPPSSKTSEKMLYPGIASRSKLAEIQRLCMECVPIVTNRLTNYLLRD